MTSVTVETKELLVVRWEKRKKNTNKKMFLLKTNNRHQKKKPEKLRWKRHLLLRWQRRQKECLQDVPLKNRQPPPEERGGSAGKTSIVQTVKARYIRQPPKLVTFSSWKVPIKVFTIHISHFPSIHWEVCPTSY